jgi:hypothetical protein
MLKALLFISLSFISISINAEIVEFRFPLSHEQFKTLKKTYKLEKEVTEPALKYYINFLDNHIFYSPNLYFAPRAFLTIDPESNYSLFTMEKSSQYSRCESCELRSDFISFTKQEVRIKKTSTAKVERQARSIISNLWSFISQETTWNQEEYTKVYTQLQIFNLDIKQLPLDPEFINQNLGINWLNTFITPVLVELTDSKTNKVSIEGHSFKVTLTEKEIYSNGTKNPKYYEVSYFIEKDKSNEALLLLVEKHLAKLKISKEQQPDFQLPYFKFFENEIQHIIKHESY